VSVEAVQLRDTELDDGFAVGVPGAEGAVVSGTEESTYRGAIFVVVFARTLTETEHVVPLQTRPEAVYADGSVIEHSVEVNVQMLNVSM